MKRVYAREEVCVGCKLCEVYCATAHSEYPLDIVKAFLKQKTKPIPRILVEDDSFISFALQCRHCDEAPCTKACISSIKRTVCYRFCQTLINRDLSRE